MNVAKLHVSSDTGPRPVTLEQGRQYRTSFDEIAPAGALGTTIADAAKWLRLQLGKGIYDGKRLLSVAVMDESHRSQIPVRSQGMWFFGPFTSYGLGWNVNDYRGNKEVSHLGGGLGQHCLIAMLPEQRVGLVVLTNLGAHQLPRALALRVFDAYLGHSSTDWSTELLSRKRTAAAQSDAREAQLTAARARGTRPSLPVLSYAGTYTHPGFGDIQITAEGDTLGLRFGVNSSNLEHWQYDVYRYRLTWMTTPEPQLFVRFRLGTAGRVEDLIIEDVGVFTRR